MIKVIVVKVGEPPKVEECDSPFQYIKRILAEDEPGDPYIQIVTLEDGVELYCDEEGMETLPLNRVVADRAKPLPPGFTEADIINPSPEFARPGEMGEHHIHGHFLLARHDYDKDEPMSLTDDDIAKWTFNLLLP